MKYYVSLCRLIYSLKSEFVQNCILKIFSQDALTENDSIHSKNLSLACILHHQFDFNCVNHRRNNLNLNLFLDLFNYPKTAKIFLKDKIYEDQVAKN